MRPIADERSDSEAVINARNRIALIKGSLGTRHPEYASALNQLALLLIMQGDADAAEPLLREALDVRRATLGENHPDYATNLSSLGGVLWARGLLEEAEPLLQKAAEVRCATLGPAHPKSVVSLNSLDQLQKAKRDWQRSQPVVERREPVKPPVEIKSAPVRIEVRPPVLPLEPVPSLPTEVAQPVATVPLAATAATEIGRGLTDAIAGNLDTLRKEFAELAEAFTRAANGLTSEGLVVPDTLTQPALAARQRFESLRASVVDAHKGLGLALPETGMEGLDGIATLLPALKTAETSRSEWRETRGKAIALTNRVDRLTCPASPDFEALARCRKKAQAIRNEIQANDSSEPSQETKSLAKGEHPFSALLSLVEASETVSDAEWASWFESVEGTYGNALAVAAARGRLTEVAGS